jgi:hypothetical protein
MFAAFGRPATYGRPAKRSRLVMLNVQSRIASLARFP